MNPISDTTVRTPINVQDNLSTRTLTFPSHYYVTVNAFRQQSATGHKAFAFDFASYVLQQRVVAIHFSVAL